MSLADTESDGLLKNIFFGTKFVLTFPKVLRDGATEPQARFCHFLTNLRQVSIWADTNNYFYYRSI